jgi:hypothetical protein
MKLPLLSIYLFSALPALAGFTTPKANDVWHIGDSVTIAWDSDWPVWGDGPASSALLYGSRHTRTSLTQRSLTASLLHLVCTQIQTNCFQEIPNAKADGETTWTIDVPEEFIVGLNGFVFRFKEHRDGDVRHGGWQYASYPAFPLFPAVEAESASSSAATLSTSASSSASFDASISNKPETPSTDLSAPINDSPSRRKTSTGAIAGIVLGSLVGVAEIFGIALLMLRRRKRSTNKLASRETKGESSASNTEASMGPLKHKQAKHTSGDLPEWVPPR